MNDRVIILGGGESLQEGIDLGLWNAIEDEEIWSLNSRYEIMPYMPTRQLWTDIMFFFGYEKDLMKLKDKGCEELIAREVGRFYEEFDITVYKTTAYKELAEQHGWMFTSLMGLSGFFALSVAVMRGYKEIYLLGYDNPDQKCNVSKDFDYYLQFKDSKIINVSPESNIKAFEKVNYNELFKRINIL